MEKREHFYIVDIDMYANNNINDNYYYVSVVSNRRHYNATLQVLRLSCSEWRFYGRGCKDCFQMEDKTAWSGRHLPNILRKMVTSQNTLCSCT